MRPESTRISNSDFQLESRKLNVCNHDSAFLTCLILSKAGSAVQPALTATDSGDSMESPISAQASFANRSAISCHNA